MGRYIDEKVNIYIDSVVHMWYCMSVRRDDMEEFYEVTILESGENGNNSAEDKGYQINF